MLFRSGGSKRSLAKLKDIVAELDSPELERKVTEVEINLTSLELTELRLLSALENGAHPGAESSILKIRGTEIQQKLTELYVEAAGEYALVYPGPHGYGDNAKPAGPEFAAQSVSKYLNMRKTSIYGGSNEIQKNIISKLDIRRAQVLVEAIIVELSETAARNLGVETFYNGTDSDSIPIGITRFGGAGPDLLSIVGAASNDQDVKDRKSVV